MKHHHHIKLLLLLLPTSKAWASYTLNLPLGVTPISQEIYHLHMLIFWCCVAIGIGVFGVMLYAIIWHRKSRGVTAAQFHDSTTVEIIWSVIPFFILVAMAVPATRVLIKMDDTTEADLTIKITGFMWRWHYDYLGKNLNFMSTLTTPYLQIKNRDVKGENYLLEVDNPLVVPINKKIRLLTTSNDVIHSWWVPQLGVKKDAIPGFINETWTQIQTPGTYRGQCAELCGANHGFMPIVVEAKTQQDYEAWLAHQQEKELL